MRSTSECNLELFIFPINYQTLSFHHQGEYKIKFSSFENSFITHSMQPMQQMFTMQRRRKVDRNGNVWNVDGYITKRLAFKTDKQKQIQTRFQIEYNDQIVKFKTGFIARISPKSQERIILHLQLLKVTSTQKEPVNRNESIKKVSSQKIQLNLLAKDDGFSIRRIVFATNEYISFVDVAYQFVKLSHFAPLNLEQDSIETRSIKKLHGIYKCEVIDRLRFYKELKVKTQLKIRQFQEIRFNHFSFTDIYKITSQFEEKFVQKEIDELDYIAMQYIKFDQNFDSNMELQKEESTRSIQEQRSLRYALCSHYQCQIGELIPYIKGQGFLIQSNIRALFERLVQLNISLIGEKSFFIAQNEINRAKNIVEQSEKYNARINASSIKSLHFNQQHIKTHKNSISSFLKQLPNATGMQLKQPYMKFINETNIYKKQKLSIENTLTVFIHGYKGSEYDLSKIKSHLNLLLGFTNFYSVKGIGTDKVNQYTIHKLGETAANQISNYLNSHPTFLHVNIIGFSLGGVVARAMLPWLETYKNKLNILITIASPHLGIRQIESCIVRAGLCYMRRIAGIQSIRELNSERNGQQYRYLMKLAQGDHLEWFKSIVLVGSHADKYVPSYSSLAEYHGEDEITLSMSQRLKEKLKRAIRCVVQLQYDQSVVDLITLRRTHISFLQQDSFIRTLIMKLQNHFLYTSQQS